MNIHAECFCTTVENPGVNPCLIKLYHVCHFVCFNCGNVAPWGKNAAHHCCRESATSTFHCPFICHHSDEINKKLSLGVFFIRISSSMWPYEKMKEIYAVGWRILFHEWNYNKAMQQTVIYICKKKRFKRKKKQTLMCSHFSTQSLLVLSAEYFIQ